MSVSKGELQSYCKYIKSHPAAFTELMERFDQTLYQKWKGATEEEALILRAISDNQLGFVNQLNRVFESITEDEPVNDTEEGQDNG